MGIRCAKIALLVAVGAAALVLRPDTLGAELGWPQFYRYQYAAKFACGQVTATPPNNSPLFAVGNYRTAINVHNPVWWPVRFRYKVARAGLYVDGPISQFTSIQIGPDAAQVFDCGRFYALLGVPPTTPIDGFFVIETDVPFDVVGYYTATTGGAATVGFTSIDVEKYRERDISRSPLCRGSLQIDLSDPNNWLKSDGNPPVSIVAPAGWDPARQWMSYAQSYVSGANIPVQHYSYEVKFCSCSQSTATVSNGSVKSDDDSLGNIGPNTLFNIPPFGNFSPGAAAPINSSAIPVVGQQSFAVTVRNWGGPTGLSIVGTLTLGDGYLGTCRH